MGLDRGRVTSLSWNIGGDFQNGIVARAHWL
jgi:hypothetical protein